MSEMEVEKPKKIRMKKKDNWESTHDDPKDALRELIRQYEACLRAIQMNESTITPRAAKKDFGRYKKGDAIPIALSQNSVDAVKGYIAVLEEEKTLLKRRMTKVLKEVPLHKEYLQYVYGCGPVLAAYFIAYLNVAIREERGLGATKPSHLRRYCGLAVINGRLEGSAKGEVNHFNKSLRKVIFQAFQSLWKHQNSKNAGTSKHLKIWMDYMNRMANSARVQEGVPGPRGGKAKGSVICTEAGRTVSAKAHAISTGWHKAADVLIEDFYIVARTMAGLEVWPTYQTAKLGYTHGGKVSDGQPVKLTLEQALTAVGVKPGEPVEEVELDESIGDCSQAAE